MCPENLPPHPSDDESTEIQPDHQRPDLTIGPYHLMQRIGEGGMGEVWMAEQREPVRRRVAVKIIKHGMDTAQVVARFEAERQVLAMLDHPGIARIYDAGSTSSGRPYFAMEYVPGEPLTTYCDRHRLSNAERIAIFLRVCEGVQHAHQKGIIHRDLKPSNVLVTLQDGHPVPKIIDFGIAKATSQKLTERTLFTALGVLIGTPEYMSPEQAELTGLDVDTRTDVYSLGVMLYELVAGSLPFDSRALREAGLDEIRRRIREVDPPKPSTRVSTLGDSSIASAHNRRTEPGRLASQLKGDLDWIAMKALEKDRTRRYGGVSELSADLERYLDHQPVLAGPPSAIYKARKFARRHRFGVSAAGAFLLLLVGFAAVMTIQAGRIARERDRANREAERANLEAASAIQVADFLSALFRVSDPAEARGKPLTAREVLDIGAARIDTDLGRDPVLQARLLLTLGDVYRNLGVLDRAEVLVERSVQIRRAQLGPEAVDTLRASSLLGCIYDFRGKTDQAESLLASTLASERRVIGADHPNAIKTLVNLANLYDSQGRYDKAEPLMREALDRRSRVLGADHPDTLASGHNLAISEFRAGRYAEAEQRLLGVIAGLSRTVGGDHPNTLTAQDMLATIYESEQRPANARRILEQTFETKLRLFGPENMETLGTKLGLANVARLERDFPRAESLFRDTLAAQVRLLGPDHPDTFATRASLATMLGDAGRYDAAEPVWLETLERMRRVLGRDHPDTADCYIGLAGIEASRGRKDAAVRLLQQAVRVNPAWAGRLSTVNGLERLKGYPAFDQLLAAAK